ncbi:hypothetical protein BC351_10690 [Paenibacillus ferrarius]|uniref:peptidyl-tRNA hydrolase n=1 Tax=Paenibacillus ferrarius TaxID=1469647 RepID=A0A1V4H8Z9_9BACL|nr:aminoacyl-tRNA hydrolase [Paenibacillus ferrarius]OPH47648.1 hypothetical protein BC351_10690 [Paenibacillus ferrarius]
MYIEMKNDEYEKFEEYVAKTEKSQGAEWDKLREMVNNHKDSRKSDDDELVQYFIVNSELNMSAGKIAAQVAHVETLCTMSILNEGRVQFDEDDDINQRYEMFYKWLNHNQPKIILRGKQKELEKLIEQGWYYICDNGRTEIPEGSLTVIGCSPEWKSVMKPIVKRFQLL